MSDAVGAPRSRFADPSRTIAFADAALADGNAAAGVIEYSFIEPRWWPDTLPAVRPDPSIHFRHGKSAAGAGTAAAAWLDGHVSAERRTFTARSGVYPGDPAALGTGWFGTADDNALFDDE
jgi:prepilin-type processing-associated H-X9-DG protein